MSLLATPERPEQQGPLDLPALRAQTVRMEPMAQQEQLDLLARRGPTARMAPMARPVQLDLLALQEQTEPTVQPGRRVLASTSGPCGTRRPPTPRWTS